MMWSTQVESAVDADIVPQDTETSDGFTVVIRRRREKRGDTILITQSPATEVVRSVPIPVPATTAAHDREGKRLMVVPQLIVDISVQQTSLGVKLSLASTTYIGRLTSKTCRLF
jgi:hypothetical protein